MIAMGSPLRRSRPAAVQENSNKPVRDDNDGEPVTPKKHSPSPAAAQPRFLLMLMSALVALVFIGSLMNTGSLSTSREILEEDGIGMVGDADLTHLKTNVNLTRTMAQLASTQRQTYALAGRESGGFFTDIPDTAWNMLKLKAHGMQPNTRGDPRRQTKGNLVPSTWFQNHYDADFCCTFERRIGRLGDGGKWVCDPHRITMKANTEGCLVYSVGSNGDASFEAAILQDVSPECEIHVFDFGNYAQSVKRQTQTSDNVHYHQWGISDVTTGTFKTLQDTVQQLGHSGRTIDIFKIDCEGCELDTFASWFTADVVLKQILVEVHYDLDLVGSRSFSFRRKMKLPNTVDMFERLYREGYVITHKEPNVEFSPHKGLCVEYNFLFLSTDFWNDRVELMEHATTN